MPKIELIQGDCLERMKDIPDGSIDLTVTSPPYDNLRTYNGNNALWGEHVWKAVRRAVSHNHTFSRLDNLAERFETHLTSTTFESSFLDRYGYNSLCSMFK